MNGDLARNAALLEGVCAASGQDVEIVVCPPFPYLAQAHERLVQSGVLLGAQNVAAFADGAFTGETSAAMLKDLGCSWVIVGHSERRALFGESNEVVASKLHRVTEAGLCPILCVGETLEQRESGRAEEVVASQLAGGLADMGSSRCVLAYEPVWAIGTGRTATPVQAQGMHEFIRECVRRRGLDGESVRILYGGSVNPANAAELFACPDIDGALVGGASLEANGFLAICAAAAAS